MNGLIWSKRVERWNSTVVYEMAFSISCIASAVEEGAWGPIPPESVNFWK